MSLRFSVLVLLILVLAGCGEADGDAGADASPAHGEHDSLPLPKRLAFMSGHVEAGLALYRAGAPEMAAKHLLHPVSETHAAEREGLADLGFDAGLFVAVSEALDQGLSASSVEPQLAAAEANLAAVARRAGGDPSEIIDYLLDTIVEEYEIGVRDGRVTDPGEYQDAFGFATVARDRAGALPGDRRDGVRAALDELIALWNGAPLPPESPASPADVETAVENVRRALGS